MGDLSARRAAYARLSTRLAFVDDTRLLAWLGDSRSTGEWAPFWGRHQRIELDGAAVFVKRIPVTDLERANAFSTRNAYSLPLFYNYGAGSVGFGAFRELVSHIKTTNWVLEGACENFPLMYHYRLLTREPCELDGNTLAAYIGGWADRPEVGRYVADRAAATSELVVFLEHFPHDLAAWLPENQHAVDAVIDGVQCTVSFLRGHDVAHFDAHFGNFLTDGDQVYLTDFGLLLDGAFDLGDDERAFLAAHRNYDQSLALVGLGTCLFGPWMAMTPEARSVLHAKAGVAATETNLLAIMRRVLTIIEDAPTIGLAVHPAQVAALVRYRDIIIAMSEFLDTLRENPRKDTPYDADRFERLQRAANIPS